MGSDGAGLEPRHDVNVMPSGDHHFVDRDACRLSVQSEGLKANEGDAIKAFNDKNNDQFHVLDLYVFCINLADGKFTSQLDQSLVGTSAESLRYGQDQYGKRLLSTLREAPEGKVISVAYSRP